MKNLSADEQSCNKVREPVPLPTSGHLNGSSHRIVADEESTMGKAKNLNRLQSLDNREILDDLCVKTNELGLYDHCDKRFNIVNCRLDSFHDKQQSLSQNDCFHMQNLKLNFSSSLDDYNSQLITSLPNISDKCKSTGKAYSKDDIDIMSTSPSKDTEFAFSVCETEGANPPSENEEKETVQDNKCDEDSPSKQLPPAPRLDLEEMQNVEDAGGNSCSLTTALQSVPLLYNSVTKSLVIQVQSPSTGSSSPNNDAQDEASSEPILKEGITLTTLDRTERHKESASNSLPRLGTGSSLSRIGTEISLARTDASSSLSLSSLSTDFSLSTADDLFERTNFFDYDGGSLDINLQGRKPYEHSGSSSLSSSRSDAVGDDHHAVQGAKSKRKGFTSFLPR